MPFSTKEGCEGRLENSASSRAPLAHLPDQGRPPSLPREFRDLPYSLPGKHERQMVDLYLPREGKDFPVAVWIHGGGWHSCDRRVSSGPSYFLDRGIAFLSVGYRLISGENPFPTPINDCFRALDWLGRNAAHYHLDSKRMGVFGHSAGAHLSALLLLTQTQSIFGRLPANVCLRSGVLWSGPFDLSRERANWPGTTFPWDEQDPFSRTFFPQGKYDEAFARWASPASYVNAGMPALSIVHGDRDDVVPFAQAADFAAAALKAGADVRFCRDAGKGHEMPGEIWPSAAEFFSETL